MLGYCLRGAGISDLRRGMFKVPHVGSWSVEKLNFNNDSTLCRQYPILMTMLSLAKMLIHVDTTHDSREIKNVWQWKISLMCVRVPSLKMWSPCWSLPFLYCAMTMLASQTSSRGFKAMTMWKTNKRKLEGQVGTDKFFIFNDSIFKCCKQSF